jgi:hypothetical protein
VRTFGATKPAPGTAGVVIPGDPETLAEVERRLSGVPLTMHYSCTKPLKNRGKPARLGNWKR